MKTTAKAVLASSALVLVASIGYINRSTVVDVPKPQPHELIITPAQHHTIDVQHLATGTQVTLPLADEKYINGTINSVHAQINSTHDHSKRIMRYGGKLDHGDGTFALAVEEDGTVSGMIVIHSKRTGYMLKSTTPGEPLVFELVSINKLVCSQDSEDNNMDITEAGATVETGTINSGTITITVPQLASKPTSKVHLYLDFDGERVQDPLWNGGKVIEAAAPSYTAAQIQEIWTIVAERFAAFNINVTTKLDDYTKAEVNCRARAIFTPTNSWRPGFGGIAMINSVRNAGKSVWSPTIPCWVFTNMLGRLRSVGECAAHELGHTLGLTHDGQGKNAYYYGQGSWAPIMGVTYNAPVAQWSKGEYTDATNKQDDIAVILSNKNVTYAATSRPAPTMTFVNNIRATGVICNENDVATYRTSITRSGSLTMTGTVPTYGALNIKLELVAANGNVIATSETLNSLNTTTSVAVTPGTYTVRVQGVGEGDVKTTGYTKYGSIGTFTLVTELK